VTKPAAEELDLRAGPSYNGSGDEITMSLPIHTERLLLRRFTYDDIPALQQLVAQPSVQRVTPEIEPTEPGLREYVERQGAYLPFEQEKVFDLAVERKEDGALIGLVTLVCEEDRQGAIGWAFGAEHRGQGYATEAARALIAYAFGCLGLARIEAETSSGNERSWRLAERLGMQREGHLREATVQEGQWLDTYVYGIEAEPASPPADCAETESIRNA
jgi:RimJ/RimL family protein N-acetyltransferase